MNEDSLSLAHWSLTARGPSGVCCRCATDLWQAGTKYCRTCAHGNQITPRGDPRNGTCYVCAALLGGRKRVYCSANCLAESRRAWARHAMAELRCAHPEIEQERKRLSRLKSHPPIEREGFCIECGAPFIARGAVALECSPSYRIFCGKTCQRRSYERTLRSSKTILTVRTTHTTKRPMPLLATPAPSRLSYPAILSGGLFTLGLTPASPPRGTPQATARLLHGAISTLLGQGHGQQARFALWFSSGSWYCYLYLNEDAKRFAGRTCFVEVGDTSHTLQWGPPAPCYAPPVPTADHYRVTITTRTPVSTTRDGHSTPSLPIRETIYAAAVGVASRIGRTIGALEVYSCETRVESVSVRVGGHIGRGAKEGTVVAWTGRVVCEVNVEAAWLLLCGNRAGIGGLTSMGFGRVRVLAEEVSA